MSCKEKELKKGRVSKEAIYIWSPMTMTNDQIESIKDDGRVNKAVAIKFSKKPHVRNSPLLHPVLVQLQTHSNSFQDLESY